MRIYDGNGEHVEGQRRERSRAGAARRSVGVADYAVTVDDTTLVTSGLGSCVAVGLFDGGTAAGLLHVMLPTANGRAVDNPAKFADTGVRTLLRSLDDVGASEQELSAKIAGGSEMITFRSRERSIGDRNVEAVRDALDEAGIPLLDEDVGGEEGRSVEFDLSGDLHIRTARAGERVL